MADLSKELDQLRLKYGEGKENGESDEKSNEKEKQRKPKASMKMIEEHEQNFVKNKPLLMGFRDLVQPNIISLCSTNGINRYAVNSLI